MLDTPGTSADLEQAVNLAALDAVLLPSRPFVPYFFRGAEW